jgi:hypothetical protein
MCHIRPCVRGAGPGAVIHAKVSFTALAQIARLGPVILSDWEEAWTWPTILGSLYACVYESIALVLSLADLLYQGELPTEI